MKVPPHQHEAVVRFYRDVLGLEQLEHEALGFKFGSDQLWIDRVPSMSQAELWLEVVTEDTKAAGAPAHRRKDALVDFCRRIAPGMLM